MNNPAPQAARDTVAQLKADIDAGRTGDKVASGDHGLSPLGTDDEAGGDPLTPEQISLARRQETRIGSIANKRNRGLTGMIPILVMAAVIAVIAAVVVIFYLMKV